MNKLPDYVEQSLMPINVSYLHRFIAASDVCVVDEDIGHRFLPRHLKQEFLVIGAILWIIRRKEKWE